MTFGSINRSEIEIKPSGKGDFLKTITKETESPAEFLKNLQPKAFSLKIITKANERPAEIL